MNEYVEEGVELPLCVLFEFEYWCNYSQPISMTYIPPLNNCNRCAITAPSSLGPTTYPQKYSYKLYN